MSELIQTEQVGQILSIRFNRPEKKNAFTEAMYASVTDFLKRADLNNAISVIHLTGSGDSFCAGNDIADFWQIAQQGVTDTPARAFLQQLYSQRKPIVAAVNGIAIGVGVTMLLHCDLVYASCDARFRMPFVDLGLVPEGGSSALLPQMVGHRRAAELLLATQGFDAGQAERLGIVNEVCSSQALPTCSWEMAEVLASKPAQALQQAKQMMKTNPEKPLAEVIDSEIDQFMAALSGDEAKQILRQLIEPSNK